MGEMNMNEEGAKHLGFCGIIKESYDVVISWKRIFSQITWALILPLSVTFISHIFISEMIYGEMFSNVTQLEKVKERSKQYQQLSELISSELISFLIFTIFYYVFLIIFSLLATSAVIYTIACIYTAKDPTFKVVISVVPKVWRRLMVTFLWSSFLVAAYNSIAFIVIICLAVILGPYGAIAFFGSVIIYLMGLVYIGIVWHLACVISVMEDERGIQAMKKSMNLIKGKIMVASGIYIWLSLSFGTIQMVSTLTGATDGPLGLSPGAKLFIQLSCVIILLVLILSGLVTQTIVYFVCKSYHHENINKSALADHLDEYLGEYMLLKGMEVQLEQI